MSIEYHLPYALVIRELEWDFQVDIVTG